MKGGDLEKRHLELSKAMVEADGSNIFPIDLYAFGCLKRSLANCKGFYSLISSRNLICAAGIIRMQLDTLLRFYAVFLVSDPHAFTSKVMGGERVKDFQDMAGKKLTDAHLKRTLSKMYPWMENVYNETSGYIHFSKKHINSAINQISEDGSFDILISSEDIERAEPYYDEACGAFFNITSIFLDYIEGWVVTKNNPKLLADVKEGLNT